MSNPGLPNLDSVIHSALRGPGFADLAQYMPSRLGVSRECRVYVDYNAPFNVGVESATVAAQIVVTVLREDFPVLPEPTSVFVVGSERLVVDRVEPIDSSRAACLVHREAAR